MQRLTLDIPAGSVESGERFFLVGNVDAAGRATAAIDMNHPLTGAAAVLVVPLGDADADHVRQVTTPALYFGRYKFQVVAQDVLGNVSSDMPRTFIRVVNSGPRASVNVRHAGSSNGRPVFGFVPPGQF